MCLRVVSDYFGPTSVSDNPIKSLSWSDLICSVFDVYFRVNSVRLQLMLVSVIPAPTEEAASVMNRPEGSGNKSLKKVQNTCNDIQYNPLCLFASQYYLIFK